MDRLAEEVEVVDDREIEGAHGWPTTGRPSPRVSNGR